jgi:hypothetical protein
MKLTCGNIHITAVLYISFIKICQRTPKDIHKSAMNPLKIALINEEVK